MSPTQVPADDRGLLLGDGLFETILWEGGALRAFDPHLARMVRGCAVIGVAAPDPAAALAAAERAIAEAGLGAERASVRLTLTAGSGRGLERAAGSRGRLIVQAFPAPRPAGPVSLAVVGIRRNETSPLSRIKSLSYLDNILARRQAREVGAAEALLLNTRGELACAAAANILWLRDGRLFTPSLACGVLDGTERARAIAAARARGMEVVEGAFLPEALHGAEGVVLTNSLMGVCTVSSLDGRPFPQSGLAAELSS